MSDSYQNYSTSSGDEIRLIFACSGGADVGHISDLAARQMMKEGCGKMFCLAGLGGNVDAIVETTKKADHILAIDGCPVDCTKNTLENTGIDTFRHFRVTELGFEKGKSPADDEKVTKTAEYGKSLW